MSLFLKRLTVIIVFFGIVFGSFFLAYKKWMNYRENQRAKKYFYSSEYKETLAALNKLPRCKIIKTRKQLLIEQMRAITNQKLGDPKKADVHWRKIEENTKYQEFKDESYFYLGLHAWEEEKIEDSMKYFINLLDHYPKSQLMGDSLFYVALYHKRKNDLIKARDFLERVVEEHPNAGNIEEAITELGSLNIRLLFKKVETPISEMYIVKPGDSLALIAKKFSTTVELLKESNEMKTVRIKPHDRLKIITAKFTMTIDKSQNVLFLKADGKFFKRYLVGTGKSNSTPTGTFKVTEKLTNPTWYKPDGGVAQFGSKDNLLGTRWMSINYPGYGIHGTWEPDSVGKQSSMGCIRLRNEEVEELYKIIPVGTEVIIVD